MTDTANLINSYNEFLESEYKTEIDININNGKNILYIDFLKLSLFSPELSEELLDNPKDNINFIKMAIKNLTDKDSFEVYLKNIPDLQKRNINHIINSDLNKLIKIRCMVSSRSENYLKTKLINFECPSCGNNITIPQTTDFYCEPSKCGCGRKGKFRIISKKFIDRLDVSIEDLPEALKPTEMTINIRTVFEEHLARNNINIYPGAKLEIIGYLIAEEKFIERRKTSMSSFLFIACGYHNIEENQKLNITKEDLKIFEKIKNSNNPAKYMANAVFSDIEGNEDIKEMSIIQQFGGTLTPDGKRDFIHILLVGDPGTCKTDMCLRTMALNPSSRFSTAKQTTEVGLTATAIKDDKTKRWTVKAGLLSKCNGAIVGIDEISQMPIERQDALRTPMESGILPFNKAGMSVIMQSSTAIYGTCNPKSGKIISEVVQISPKVVDMSQPLLDRFDIIYKISDKIDSKLDEIICSSMLSRYTFVDDEPTFDKNVTTFDKNVTTFNKDIHTNNNDLSVDVLKKYIFYCKSKNVQSINLSKRLYTYTSKWYSNLRARSTTSTYEGKKPSPRIIESVLRVARALARIKQKDTVTIKEFKQSTDYFERMIGISKINTMEENI